MVRKFLRLAGVTIALLAVLLACQQTRHSGGAPLADPADGAIRVATFNVHYIWAERETGAWSLGDWEQRKGPMDATFKRLDADIVAFQEMESFEGGNDDTVNHAREWLLANNPGYAAAAVGDWREFPSTQPIFYRKDRLRRTDQGYFFFSETPEVMYSPTFNGSWSAFASWAEFEPVGGGAPFRALNIHLDFSSGENRRRSIELVAERVSAWLDQGLAVVLVGDFNTRLGSDLHERMEAVGLRFAEVDGSTFHFNQGLNLFGAIDHIAYSTEIAPAGSPVVFREKLGPVWPSDHYPVVLDLVFP